MEKHILQTILEAAIEDQGEDAGVSLRSYSGRGMYGEECLGVDADSLPTVFQAVLSQVLETSLDLGRGDKSDLVDCFGNARTDSMGRGTIIYFPGIPYVADKEQDDLEFREVGLNDDE